MAPRREHMQENQFNSTEGVDRPQPQKNRFGVEVKYSISSSSCNLTSSPSVQTRAGATGAPRIHPLMGVRTVLVAAPCARPGRKPPPQPPPPSRGGSRKGTARPPGPGARATPHALLRHLSWDSLEDNGTLTQ